LPVTNTAQRLAGVLSPFARPAHAGGAPVIAMDAHTPGSGKTLLCDATGVIVTGRPMPRSPYTREDEELRKRITAHLLAGDRLALIDNVPAGAGVGWPALDMALTGEVWRDRILGRSELAGLPTGVCWYVTGNNLAVRGDMARRLLRVRVDAKEERPQERSDFRHAPLVGWIRSDRSRLVSAALTILRAYIVAGRPDQELQPFGSFEGWSGLVRSALVWAGLADPVDCCADKEPDVDPEADAHREALVGWRELDPAGRGLTVSEACDRLRAAPERYKSLRLALSTLCRVRGDELPAAHTIGNRLRVLRGRPRTVDVDGVRRTLAFDAAGKGPGRVLRWSVVRAGV